MHMLVHQSALQIFLLLCLCHKCLSTCTLPSSEWTGTWYDSIDNGEITFNYANNALSVDGWQRKIFSSDVTGWDCVMEDTNNRWMVFFGKQPVDAYNFLQTASKCIKWTKITDFSFHYQILADAQANANYDRVWVFNVNKTVSEYCNPTNGPAATEYGVLVKKGNEADLLTYYPTPLLGNFAYLAEKADSSQYCTAGSYLDVCSNRTQMVFNMSLCSTKVAFSASGELFAVYSHESGSTYYVTSINTDNTITASVTYRFVCVVVETSGTNVLASINPGQCLSNQTASSATTNGYKLTMTANVTCPFTTSEASSEGSGSNAGLIAGIVVAILVIAGACIGAFFVYRYMKKRRNSVKHIEEAKTESKQVPPKENGVPPATEQVRDAVDIEPAKRNTLTPISKNKPSNQSNGGLPII